MFVKTAAGNTVDLTQCFVGKEKIAGDSYEVRAEHMAAEGSCAILFLGTKDECQEYIDVLSRDLATREWNADLKQFVIVADIGRDAQCHPD